MADNVALHGNEQEQPATLQTTIQFNQANLYADKTLITPEIITAVSKDKDIKDHFLNWCDVASSNSAIVAQNQSKQLDYVNEDNKRNAELQELNLKNAKTEVWLRGIAAILPSCFSFLISFALIVCGALVIIFTDKDSYGWVATIIGLIIPAISVVRSHKN